MAGNIFLDSHQQDQVRINTHFCQCSPAHGSHSAGWFAETELELLWIFDYCSPYIEENLCTDCPTGILIQLSGYCKGSVLFVYDAAESLKILIIQVSLCHYCFFFHLSMF
ncbi:hypothetical protein AVEN_202617-1 [Araneus ventricosus]|uniref:Uncharacterized protein n=1 Tax=Araneus ventricosus TaxID=182803 RepID=A0A4Y2W2B8_ARAVE|nr:hypothetical protein AVEN_202617-1 [Araneus ventricosus]